MSDKSHDAEPDEELVEPKADTADTDALDAAQEEVAAADDEQLERLAEQFDDGEEEPAPAAIVRKTAKAPVKKTTPTRKRDQDSAEEEDPYRAKNPAQFVKQSAGELQKVVWPTWPQLRTMFVAVLVFVLIIILIVSLLDAGFGSLIMWLFGGN